MLLVSGGYSLLMSGWIAGLGLKVHWVSLPILPLSIQGWVVQSWGFRSEALKEKWFWSFCLQFDDWCSEKNRENYLKEAFKQKEWRNQVIIEHWVCSTWPLNNQAQEHKLILMNYQESLIAMHQHPIQGSKAQSSFNSKVIIVDYKSWDNDNDHATSSGFDVKFILLPCTSIMFPNSFKLWNTNYLNSNIVSEN